VTARERRQALRDRAPDVAGRHVHHTTTTAPVDLDVLRSAVRAEAPALLRDILPGVLRDILARVADPRPSLYSTRKGCGVPGLGDVASKRAIEACPHAITRGRWVVVDRDRFEAWETTRQAAAAPAPAAAVVEPWSPLAALEGAGLRPTRVGVQQ
jgi:hypothetical protein